MCIADQQLSYKPIFFNTIKGEPLTQLLVVLAVQSEDPPRHSCHAPSCHPKKGGLPNTGYLFQHGITFVGEQHFTLQVTPWRVLRTLKLKFSTHINLPCG